MVKLKPKASHRRAYYKWDKDKELFTVTAVGPECFEMVWDNGIPSMGRIADIVFVDEDKPK